MNDAIERGGYAEAGNVLREALIQSFKQDDPNGMVSYYLDELGGSVFNLLGENARQMILSNLTELVGSDAAAEIYRSAFNLTWDVVSSVDEAMAAATEGRRVVMADTGLVIDFSQLAGNVESENQEALQTAIAESVEEVVQESESPVSETIGEVIQEAMPDVQPVEPETVVQVDWTAWPGDVVNENTDAIGSTVQDKVDGAVQDAVDENGPVNVEVPVQFSYNADVSGLSEKAQSMVRSMEAAMELGYDMQQLGEQLNNNRAFFGDQAFLEALPVLQEMMAAYREHLDTSGITEPMQEAADTSSQATESIVGDVATLSGQSVGGVDGSALIGSLSALSSSVWSHVNSILSGLSQLGGASVGSYAKRGLRVTAAGHYPAFASGGFPDSGSIFMADENGDIELKGRMGSQPVVANNQQIIAGISQGVSTANETLRADLLSELQSINNAIRHGAISVNMRPSSSFGRMNARSSSAYERVSGR